MSAQRKFAQLRALPSPQRWALATAALLLGPCGLVLRLVGFARMKASIEREPIAKRGPPTVSSAAVARMVDVAARHLPFRSTCLGRSLLLAWMLRRRGIDAQLRIGVRLIAGVLDAHAWVESSGRPVNESSEVTARYVVFDGLLNRRAFPAR